MTRLKRTLIAFLASLSATAGLAWVTYLALLSRQAPEQDPRVLPGVLAFMALSFTAFVTWHVLQMPTREESEALRRYLRRAMTEDRSRGRSID